LDVHFAVYTHTDTSLTRGEIRTLPSLSARGDQLSAYAISASLTNRIRLLTQTPRTFKGADGVPFPFASTDPFIFGDGHGNGITTVKEGTVVSPAMALVGTWKQELAAGRPIRAFTNMTMAPTQVDLVASAVAHVMEDRLPLRVKKESKQQPILRGHTSGAHFD
jgi:hypothetical protein